MNYLRWLIGPAIAVRDITREVPIAEAALADEKCGRER
jgi:hypothetical protein